MTTPDCPRTEYFETCPTCGAMPNEECPFVGLFPGLSVTPVPAKVRGGDCSGEDGVCESCQ